MKNYQFVQNRSCEFFPCHTGIKEENFNCLFCFCPLYMLGKDCGGHYIYSKEGVKDCSHCRLPHDLGGYDFIMSKIDQVIDRVRLAEKEE